MTYAYRPSEAFAPVPIKLLAAALIALGLAACASNPQQSEAGLGGAAGRAAPGTVAEFAQTAGDRVFFESDSSELTAVATATLDKQAQWLARYPRYQITIEGHADERGTREYNFALGARRAEAAKNYLAAKGVPAVRMRTISFGKERPVSVCDDISCWSQNRRAVTVLAGAAGS
jgi:peptidoglycan-associated lipoprotein